MDINNILPMLLNLLNNNGQNLFGQTPPSQNNNANIPANVLASYPPSDFVKTPQPQQQLQQLPFSPDIISKIMPLLSNTNKQQKSSPLKISELPSVDEYEFD